MKPYLYHYSAVITEVYDGDTVTADIDLGFGLWMRGQKLRLHGIDAPELRGAEREEGLKSRDFLRGLVLGKEVTLRTIKDKRGKYGRWLAEIECDGVGWVNAAMVEAGEAAAY